jgi:hypothetical protein
MCGKGPFGDLKRIRDLPCFGMAEGQASPTLLMESLSNGYFPGSILKKGSPSRDPVEPSPPSPGWERREDRRPRRIPIPNSLLFGGRNKGEECRGNIRLFNLLSSERKPKRWMYPKPSAKGRQPSPDGNLL